MEFSHLVAMDTEITHQRTLPVVAHGNSDVDGELLADGVPKSDCEL